MNPVRCLADCGAKSTIKHTEEACLALVAVLAVIAGLAAAYSLSLLIIYKFGKLGKVKREHGLKVNAGLRRVGP